MTRCSLQRLQERAVPAGSYSRYAARRTVRDEGVGTREQPVRAPIQHSGELIPRAQSVCALVLSQGVCGLR